MSRSNASRKTLLARALGDAQADKRLEILRLVGRDGSISKAARSAGVSYKAAWQAIHTLTNLAGEELVASSVGGAGGGGARVTEAGARLLAAATQLAAARQRTLARIDPLDTSALAAPRTSMRNALRAAVVRLQSDGAGDPMVRVVLALPSGATLTSLITRESAELLGLAPGLPLLVLCKASAVRIQADDGSAAASINTLAGRVRSVARGRAHDEVTLALTGDQQVVGFTAESGRLRAGRKALACIEERAVVLALG